MLYLVTQMLAVLLFTAALALIAGWLLRGIGLRGQVDAVARERDEERRRAAALEQRLAAAQAVQSAQQASSAARPGIVQLRQEELASEALTTMRNRLAQLDGVARSQAERLTDLGQRLREKDQLLETMKRQAEQGQTGPKAPRPRTDLSPPGGLLAERPEKADRLQAISGIGPVIERVLNELGIYRFVQLARFTPDNIEWLAARIDWFPQRIQREDWVGQARRLHNEVHPEEEP